MSKQTADEKDSIRKTIDIHTAYPIIQNKFGKVKINVFTNHYSKVRLQCQQYLAMNSTHSVNDMMSKNTGQAGERRVTSRCISSVVV